ncbi:hypothetical protein PM082_004454 [Marasmius tenuissimus]|nr:hypothetical protein PM082_004454 [Marasmius tenuissimus]
MSAREGAARFYGFVLTRFTYSTYPHARWCLAAKNLKVVGSSTFGANSSGLSSQIHYLFGIGAPVWILAEDVWNLGDTVLGYYHAVISKTFDMKNLFSLPKTNDLWISSSQTEFLNNETLWSTASLGDLYMMSLPHLFFFSLYYKT